MRLSRESTGHQCAQRDSAKLGGFGIQNAGSTRKQSYIGRSQETRSRQPSLCISGKTELLQINPQLKF